MAESPETSDYTIVQQRINPTFDFAQAIRGLSFNNADDIVVKLLLHFEGNIRDERQKGILFSVSDYLQLVAWTERTVRSDKRGVTHCSAPTLRGQF